MKDGRSLLWQSGGCILSDAGGVIMCDCDSAFEHHIQLFARRIHEPLRRFTNCATGFIF